MAQPTVLVDARNVIRSRWPNLREDWFLERTRAWAESQGVRALVVFDGGAPAWADDERMEVAGSGAGIADDVLAVEAARLAGAGGTVWLISSDRGLRTRVAPYAERSIGGGSFAGLLAAVTGPKRSSR